MAEKEFTPDEKWRKLVTGMGGKLIDFNKFFGNLFGGGLSGSDRDTIVTNTSTPEMMKKDPDDIYKTFAEVWKASRKASEGEAKDAIPKLKTLYVENSKNPNIPAEVLEIFVKQGLRKIRLVAGTPADVNVDYEMRSWKNELLKQSPSYKKPGTKLNEALFEGEE